MLPHVGSFSTPIFPLGIATPIPVLGGGEGVLPPPIVPNPPPFVHAATRATSDAQSQSAAPVCFIEPAESLGVRASRSSRPRRRLACLHDSGMRNRRDRCRPCRASPRRRFLA